MVNFIEGTLLISNVLLIFFSIIYGLLIVRKHRKEDSEMWIYFLIASAIFFLSELVTVVNEVMNVSTGILRGVLRVSFGVVVLFAFLNKYSSMQRRKN